MKTQYQTTKWERLAFSFYFLGQGFVYTICSQHLMFFYTEYVLLPPLVISSILFFEKIWDAINDALFGMIMDKIHFKSGLRFLPWLRLSTILLPLSTIALFSITDTIPLGWRIALAILTYALWDVAYTICDAPIYALSTAVTSDVKERSLVMTYSSVGGTVAAGLATIVLVPFFTANGFFKTSLIVGVIAFISMSMITVFAKERHNYQKKEDQVSLKETWVYLKDNTYLQVFYLYRLVSGCLALQMLNYVAKYVFGNLNYIAYIAAFSILPILTLYILSPRLFRRFDKITVLRAGVGLGIIVNICNLCFGFQNDAVYMFFMTCAAVLAIIPSILFGSMPSDCIEYMTFKTGIRKEGITFAIQSFVAKTCAAFAGVFTGFVLNLIGYTNGGAGMNELSIVWMWRSTYVIPIFGGMLGLLILSRYHLRDKDVQLMADANAGKISKEEAEAQLSRTYK